MSDALLPCPFCGGEAISGIGIGGRSIWCGRCNASIHAAEESVTIEAWNRRASPAPDALRESAETLVKKASNLVYSGPLLKELYALDAALRSVPAPQEAPKSDALREALNRLVDIAEAYSADQSNAPHPMCANIQPVTVAEATELNEALQQARAALRSGDGWTRVEFREGSDGEWTCSGCGEDWVCEAETPEANGYKFCPGCGGRIAKYIPYRYEIEDGDMSEPFPTAPEDK